MPPRNFEYGRSRNPIPQRGAYNSTVPSRGHLKPPPIQYLRRSSPVGRASSSPHPPGPNERIDPEVTGFVTDRILPHFVEASHQDALKSTDPENKKKEVYEEIRNEILSEVVTELRPLLQLTQRLAPMLPPDVQGQLTDCSRLLDKYGGGANLPVPEYDKSSQKPLINLSEDDGIETRLSGIQINPYKPSRIGPIFKRGGFAGNRFEDRNKYVANNQAAMEDLGTPKLYGPHGEDLGDFKQQSLEELPLEKFGLLVQASKFFTVGGSLNKERLKHPEDELAVLRAGPYKNHWTHKRALRLTRLETERLIQTLEGLEEGSPEIARFDEQIAEIRAEIGEVPLPVRKAIIQREDLKRFWGIPKVIECKTSDDPQLPHKATLRGIMQIQRSCTSIPVGKHTINFPPGTNYIQFYDTPTGAHFVAHPVGEAKKWLDSGYENLQQELDSAQSIYKSCSEKVGRLQNVLQAPLKPELKAETESLLKDALNKSIVAKANHDEKKRLLDFWTVPQEIQATTSDHPNVPEGATLRGIFRTAVNVTEIEVGIHTVHYPLGSVYIKVYDTPTRAHFVAHQSGLKDTDEFDPRAQFVISRNAVGPPVTKQAVKDGFNADFQCRRKSFYYASSKEDWGGKPRHL